VGYSFTARSGSVLHVEDTGVPDAGATSGPPVLALHGIGGGAYFFSGFAKRLSDTHRVISIDLPGTGHSVSPDTASNTAPDFTLDSWIADIGDLVRDHIGEPVVVLGHSLGTILALKAWNTWPENIRALLFTCGLPKARPNIHERLSVRAESIAREGVANWGPKVSPGVFSKRTLSEMPEVTGLFERLFEEQRGPEYVREIEVLLGADMNPVVPSVTVPCFAIAGREDSYAPPASVEEFVARLGAPCDVEVLEGCGHMPFLESPEAFAATAARFLKTLAH
jgi:pimeloyl-ACP methyl ester carboxylesterase